MLSYVQKSKNHNFNKLLIKKINGEESECIPINQLNCV